MNIEDIQKGKSAKKVVDCGRVPPHYKKFLEVNNINVGLFITKAIEELMLECKQDKKHK